MAFRCEHYSARVRYAPRLPLNALEGTGAARGRSGHQISTTGCDPVDAAKTILEWPERTPARNRPRGRRYGWAHLQLS